MKVPVSALNALVMLTIVSKKVRSPNVLKFPVTNKFSNTPSLPITDPEALKSPFNMKSPWNGESGDAIGSRALSGYLGSLEGVV